MSLSLGRTQNIGLLRVFLYTIRDLFRSKQSRKRLKSMRIQSRNDERLNVNTSIDVNLNLLASCIRIPIVSVL